MSLCQCYTVRVRESQQSVLLSVSGVHLSTESRTDAVGKWGGSRCSGETQEGCDSERCGKKEDIRDRTGPSLSFFSLESRVDRGGQSGIDDIQYSVERQREGRNMALERRDSHSSKHLWREVPNETLETWEELVG